MRLSHAIAALLALFAASAQASLDTTGGELYRTAGVPGWTAATTTTTTDTTFTIMVWVRAPNIAASSNFFHADDGSNSFFVNLGAAFDSPYDTYFFTNNGEWHYNKTGDTTAKPADAIDPRAAWTFLAVTFVDGDATRMYAWQDGLNGNNLISYLAQDDFSTLGGAGTINKFLIGDRSTNDEGCECLIGPLYVYDGVALTQTQVDAQRQQLAPIQTAKLIAYSSFANASDLTTDESGTANWSVRGSVAYSASNPPVVPGGSSAGGGTPGGGSAGGSSTGGGGVDSYGGGGGSFAPLLLAFLGLGALVRRRIARR